MMPHFGGGISTDSSVFHHVIKRVASIGFLLVTFASFCFVYFAHNSSLHFDEHKNVHTGHTGHNFLGSSILGIGRDFGRNYVLLGYDTHAKSWADCGGGIEESDLHYGRTYFEQVQGNKGPSGSIYTKRASAPQKKYASWKIIAAHTACREFVEETNGLVDGDFASVNDCVETLINNPQENGGHRCDIVKNVFTKSGRSFIAHMAYIPYIEELPQRFKELHQDYHESHNHPQAAAPATANVPILQDATAAPYFSSSPTNSSRTSHHSVDWMTSVHMEKSELKWIPADVFARDIEACCASAGRAHESASNMKQPTPVVTGFTTTYDVYAGCLVDGLPLRPEFVSTLCIAHDAMCFHSLQFS